MNKGSSFARVVEAKVIRLSPIVTVRHYPRSDRELERAYGGVDETALKSGTHRAVRKEST